MMRIILVTICFLFVGAQAWAQDGYFLCIQSDNHQPFYARIAEKNHSSSAVGHLVIPGLKDSTYRVYIGFPKNKQPEQQFKVVFNQADLGFQLKKPDGGSWGLENWVSGEALKPQDYGKEYQDESYLGMRKQNDAFAGLMAAVVNDSAVLYSTIAQVKPAAPAPVLAQAPASTAPAAPAAAPPVVAATTTVPVVQETVASTTPADSNTAIVTTPDTTLMATLAGAKGAPVLPDTATTTRDTVLVTPVIVALTVAPAGSTKEGAAPVRVKGIQLLEDTAAEEGRKMVFQDTDTVGTDIIAIVIPIDKTIPESGNGTSTAPGSTLPADSNAASARPADSAVKNAATADSTEEGEDEAWKKKLVLMNSDCVNTATDNEVDKLRVKILGETNTEGRISAVRKLFKNKCLLTRQVRALSELFINDEGRYEFFKAAYPYTADTGRFKELADLLQDETYITRFKALVRIKD
ncbi:MAG: hypothetical protein P0Y53_00035 [Candidatus Pseudobacter hemicellulosilyticus]|uniref:DUF4476 domain-containing protein n=1 Tax=Candidatus Pseudobacter hemicellulosilyticus TaxID=3121375 RepID=A0AAJ6BH35_9BACT|nr:MAG: hypothetical protein P0Y53_00035 [Pseudobacter sp.]